MLLSYSASLGWGAPAVMALADSSFLVAVTLSRSSAKPGAPCKRGSGGRRSFSVRAMGDEGVSVDLLSKERNKPQTKIKVAIVSTESATRNFAIPGT